MIINSIDQHKQSLQTHLAALGCDGESSGHLRRRHLLDLEPHRVQHRVKLRRILATLLLLWMMIHGLQAGRSREGRAW